MNPLNYSLAEARKAVVSLIFLAAAVIGLFVAVDPTLTELCVGLVGPIFAVVGVFAAKNHSADDLQKALEQFKGAALALVGYFTVVPTTTAARLTIVVGAIGSVFAVYWTSNEPSQAEPAPAAPPVAGQVEVG